MGIESSSRGLFERVRQKTNLIPAIGLLALSATLLPPPSSSALSVSRPRPAVAQANYLPDEVLVKLRKDLPQTERAQLYQGLDLTRKKTIKKIGVDIVKIPHDTTVPKIINQLKKNPQVEYAEPDYIVHPATVTNDPYLLADNHHGAQNDLFIIKAATCPDAQQCYINGSGPSAWDITRGDPEVKTAILDSGIYEEHEDMAGKVVGRTNLGVSPTNSDLCGHGTSVASVAGAKTNNGIGVASAGYDTSLLNVKITGNKNADGSVDECNSTYSKIEEGLVWSADNGAKVINISYGGPIAFSQSLQDAVNYAWNHQVVVVASAGNDNNNTIVYPAGNENVIGVAATDVNDAKESVSNYGSWVDVASPDVTYAIDRNHEGQWYYGGTAGTSTAAPHVAGLAALVWSTGICQAQTRLPQNYCVTGLVEQYADRIAGTGTLWQYGRINAYAAVTGDPSTLPEPTPSPTPTPTPSPTPAPDSKIYPRGDAFVDKNYPTRNFGTERSLRTDTSPYESSYLMFDLRGLAGKSIRSATFNIRVGNDSSTNAQRLYTSGTSWKENTITYNNRPHTGSLLKSFYVKTAGAWVKVDLTSFIRSHTGQIVSLDIVNTGSDRATYYSRETSAKENIIIKY